MAKQFLSVIFSRSTLRAVDPVFCANRRNYPREKIAKNATLPPSSRCWGLLLSPRFLFILSSVPPLRERIRIMIHHFAEISSRLVTHRLLVQILQTPDTKATVMTLVKNVDDTKITFVFTDAGRPWYYLSNLFFCLYLNCTIATRSSSTAEFRRSGFTSFRSTDNETTEFILDSMRE